MLDDYVSLGILEDPVAAASKKAAAASRSQRPELLERVPWMAALKGIRSPLLRLHQGARGGGMASWRMGRVSPSWRLLMHACGGSVQRPTHLMLSAPC